MVVRTVYPAILFASTQDRQHDAEVLIGGVLLSDFVFS